MWYVAPVPFSLLPASARTNGWCLPHSSPPKVTPPKVDIDQHSTWKGQLRTERPGHNTLAKHRGPTPTPWKAWPAVGVGHDYVDLYEIMMIMAMTSASKTRLLLRLQMGWDALLLWMPRNISLNSVINSSVVLLQYNTKLKPQDSEISLVCWFLQPDTFSAVRISIFHQPPQSVSRHASLRPIHNVSLLWAGNACSTLGAMTWHKMT